MKITLDYSCSIGEEHGIDEGVLASFLKEKSGVAEAVAAERPAFMDVPRDCESIARIKSFADAERGKFRNFVVIGIGGSALGATALHGALSHPFHDLFRTPRLFVADNSDPARIEALLEVIDPKETLFNVITKSGSTAETMGIFAVVAARLKETLGADYAAHVVGQEGLEAWGLRLGGWHGHGLFRNL